MTQSYVYPAVLEPLEEGGFQVYVPALPEIVTWGDDEAHALAMAKDAIELSVEHRIAEGMEVPVPVPSQDSSLHLVHLNVTHDNTMKIAREVMVEYEDVFKALAKS